jgi:large subunit ribosomal protein L10
MARPEKAKQIEELSEIFNNAKCVVLNDFTGLNVEKISALRRLCEKAGVEFRVVKNTLAKRSIKGTPAEDLEQYFDGPTALAISRESENISAKILVKFAEEHELPRLKAGVVEGKVIDATSVLALAKLPSKEELMSKLLGGIMSPGNRLVSVLQGSLRNLLYALNAIVEKKQSEPGSAVAQEVPSQSEEVSGQSEEVPSQSEEVPGQSEEVSGQSSE